MGFGPAIMNTHRATLPLDLPAARTSVTRRRFLGGAVLAAASTAALPALTGFAAEAPATAKPVEYPRKLKLGVVGNGGRGAWIAGLFQQHGGYEIWAVADYFQAVADRCGDTLGVDKARRFSTLSGYQRLLESGVDAVALEAPPCFFPEHVQAAVDAGLHVYMAKPVAVDAWGCRQVEAAAAQATANRRVFLVDYQMPTDPHNQEIVRMIAAGEIGKPVALNSHYLAGLFADPPKTDTLESRLRSLVWCNDVAIGGGYHVNACIHAVDAALWLAGSRPVSCSGLSRRGRPDPHGDSHDVFQLLFEFENGLSLSHRGKHLNNQSNFNVVAEAQGQTGYAQLCYGGKAMLKGSENGYQGEVTNLYEAGAVRNIAKFYQCVTGANYANDTVRRSLDGALTTILGREAARRNTRLTLAELVKENQRLDLDLRGLKA
jgi:myo-inositol 2-dehydrogenase/D-chiro-inositol 1-dehydrogenase